MMCSREGLNGEIDTCQYGIDKDNYKDDNTPTEFDTRAILASYGNDGFQKPNRDLVQGVNDRYFCQPLPCEPKANLKPNEIKPPIDTNPNNPPNIPINPKQEKPQVDKKTKTTVITTSTESKPKILSDLNNYRLVTNLGSFGSGHGQFNHPASIAADPNGQRFYIADLDNNRIQVIHSQGNFITEWGTLGAGKGQFNGPGSVAVDDEHKLVFVSDIKNNRIEKFDIQGKYLGQWGGLGKGDGQFDHPGDIALDTKKEILYITDIYNNRVQAFYYDGNFITKWGLLELEVANSTDLLELPLIRKRI